jgi:hypothetical protein
MDGEDSDARSIRAQSVVPEPDDDDATAAMLSTATQPAAAPFDDSTAPENLRGLMDSLNPPRADPKRARKIGIFLAILVIGLGVWGALTFQHTAERVRGDPGLSYRNPEALDKVLARGDQAERAGDRGSAIVAYKFIVAVGAGTNPELEPYIAAARRGLTRLGVEPRP